MLFLGPSVKKQNKRKKIWPTHVEQISGVSIKLSAFLGGSNKNPCEPSQHRQVQRKLLECNHSKNKVPYISNSETSERSDFPTWDFCVKRYFFLIVVKIWCPLCSSLKFQATRTQEVTNKSFQKKPTSRFKNNLSRSLCPNLDDSGWTIRKLPSWFTASHFEVLSWELKGNPQWWLITL